MTLVQARGGKKALKEEKRRMSCALINTSKLPTHAHDCMKNCELHTYFFLSAPSSLISNQSLCLFNDGPMKYILMHY